MESPVLAIFHSLRILLEKAVLLVELHAVRLITVLRCVNIIGDVDLCYILALNDVDTPNRCKKSRSIFVRKWGAQGIVPSGSRSLTRLSLIVRLQPRGYLLQAESYRVCAGLQSLVAQDQGVQRALDLTYREGLAIGQADGGIFAHPVCIDI